MNIRVPLAVGAVAASPVLVCLCGSSCFAGGLYGKGGGGGRKVKYRWNNVARATRRHVMNTEQQATNALDVVYMHQKQ